MSFDAIRSATCRFALVADMVASVNARLAAAGWCVMHNPDQMVPAGHLVQLLNGNVLPLCSDCLDWWQANSDDPAATPVSIKPIG